MCDDLSAAFSTARAAGLCHGVVVAAGGPASVELLQAWGDAAVEPERRALTVEAVFDVASLTKVVATASACGICIDRGLLDPEAPVADYLGPVGAAGGPGDAAIRVRDLATHVSGLAHHMFGPEDGGVIEASVKAPAQWPPRQKFEYACRNFILLGRIVELVTGTELATFCEQNVFRPLGMTQTSFGPLRTGLERVVPTECSAGTISDPQARNAGRSVGNAGLFSTASDLARFCGALLCDADTGTGRIFGAASRAWLMRECSYPGLPRRSFGWDMRPCSESPSRPASLSPEAVGHTGWTGQSIWIDPAQNLFIIVLTNRSQVSSRDVNYAPSLRFRAAVGDSLAARVAALRRTGAINRSR